MEQTFENEYMDRMRRRYAKARTRAEKTALLDEAIRMCKLSRKFVIRLPNGSYRNHPHHGRPPTYSLKSRQVLVRIGLAMGQMCPLYLHAVMDTAIRDYAETKAPIPKTIADELRRMSVSTITRTIRPPLPSRQRQTVPQGRRRRNITTCITGHRLRFYTRGKTNRTNRTTRTGRHNQTSKPPNFQASPGASCVR